MTKIDSTTQDFAKAVRAELADLSIDEIADLTDGLEADLAERFAEEGTDLGSPVAYAHELRIAAGFSPKHARDGLRLSKRIGDELIRIAHSSKASLAIFEFAVSLRPVWWVARAWIAWITFIALFVGWNPTRILPKDVYQAFFLIAAILLSIQWGRRKWLTNSFFNRVLAPLNIIALMLSPLAVNSITAHFADDTNTEALLSNGIDVSGLRFDGVLVSDVQAKDSTGKVVSDLTFFDENGYQLITESKSISVLMPDVAGLRVADAIKATVDAGFTAGADFTYQVGANDKNGVIAKSSPVAGESVDSKTIIKFEVELK